MSSLATVAYGSDSDTLPYSTDSTCEIYLTNSQIAAIFKAIKEGKRKRYAESSPQMRAMIRRALR